MADCNTNFSRPPSCFDNRNATALSVLHATIPNCDSGHWQPLTPEWKGLFYTYVVLFGLLFLLLGIGGLICLCKYHTIMRLRRMKTLIAVDIALVILGLSRTLFYVVDPYGISGYCTALACVVVSQVLFSLTFPSLTAGYTLVFFTLWHVSTVKFGRSKTQQWKIVVPLCFVHYVVAVTVELITAFSGYSAIYLLLSCQFVFTAWGLLVCATFLIMGLRILKSVKITARKSAIVRRDATLTRIPPKQAGQSCISRIDTRTFDLPLPDVEGEMANGHSSSTEPAVESSQGDVVAGGSPKAVTIATNESSLARSVSTSMSSEPEPSRALTESGASSSGRSPVFSAPPAAPSKLKDFISKKHMQAIQKISIITYSVAVLGGLYSILGLVLLGIMTETLFGSCPEDEVPSGNNPYVWLTFRYILAIFELLLAILLLYSVNEVRPVVNMLRDVCCSVVQCQNLVKPQAVDGRKLVPSSSNFHRDDTSRLPPRSPVTILSIKKMGQSPPDTPGYA